MSLPAITNATLTRVQTAGFTPDYDEAGTEGADKWTGSTRVYWSEETEEVASGEVEDRRTRDTLDVYVHRYLVVPDTMTVTWTLNDVITVSRDGFATPAKGRVRNIAKTSAPGVPGVVRLVLGDE